MRARPALSESRSSPAAPHRDMNVLLMQVLCCSFYWFLILQRKQFLTLKHSKVPLLAEIGGKKPLD